MRGLTLPRLQRAMRLGIRSLWLHRLRSLLTVLGIVFGVCSVIAMLAIGEGASYEAQEQIKSLGSQNIIIRSSKPPDDQNVANQGSQSYVLQYGVTYNDAQRISETIPGVIVILPSRNIRDYVWNISRRVDCEIVGTVPWYPSMRNHRVVSGRFFTENDMDAPDQRLRARRGDGAAVVPAGIPAWANTCAWAGIIIRSLASWRPAGTRPRPTTARSRRTNPPPIACLFRWRRSKCATAKS